MSALHRFVVLYALVYAAFGVASPFMPAFFKGRGLSPEQLGILFGAGTAIRLVSGPLVVRLADLTQALRAVLMVCDCARFRLLSDRSAEVPRGQAPA
jgi:PPP family 3-phenylpropionic acid transporter